MDRINFGILGAGGIAELMAKTVGEMPNVAPYAVAARDGDRARAFAGRFGIARHYGSYREMVEDPDVDLIYIATPHSHHYEHAKLCLEHGKHVLCEKAFTATVAQAEEIIALAESKRLLITEAIWTRYMPLSRTISELLEQGVIGETYSLTASLGYNVKHNERVQKPSLAGGALLDLSVYTLNFASMVFGTDIAKITSSFGKYHTGVDGQDCIILNFASGKMASLFATMLTVTDRRGVIYGEDGYLVVENVNNPESANIYNQQWELKKSYKRPDQISGYEYQVDSAIRAIRSGALECPEMPHAETLRIMRIMEGLRNEWGLTFEDE